MSTERRQRPVKPIPEAQDPEQTVELERRWLRTMGPIAILAGIFPVVGFVLQTLASRGLDDDVGRVVSVGQALDAYSKDPGSAGIAGRQADIVSHYGDNWLLVSAAAVCTALGLLLAIPVLYGLIRGAWRRRPSFPKWFLWTPAIGGGLFAVATLVALIYQAVQYHDFTQLAAASQVNGTANDALNSAQDDLSFLQFAGGIGSLFTAVGFGAASLSAMNVGLLTRVIGSIGVLLAFLVVIPLLGQQGSVLRGFWFVAVGLTLMNRWPGGRPPAWDTGDAVPWPSRAQLMEDAERAGGGKSLPESEPAPAPKPKASSGKRKKRRK
jgi:hypothetical protein